MMRLFLIAVASFAAAAQDTMNNWTLNAFGFGSCSRQERAQNYWPNISAKGIDAWFWTGDVIYPKCSLPTCLESAYQELENSPFYQNFTNVVRFVDGVWDDHDYGINDGGREFIYKNQSQELFLDFLQIEKSSPRFKRAGDTIRVILLDTRFNREPPWLPNLSQYSFPLQSKFIALSRVLASNVPAASDFEGDILGEAQWTWLENTLADKTPAINILVSSIQVMTPISVFESWGHFPKSRQRLFQVLQRYRPRGLVILSGDVHLGQILGNTDCVTEITSSGLTHSVLEHGFFGSVLVDVIMPRSSVPRDTVYSGKNFGTFKIDDTKDGIHATGTVHDMQGRDKLQIKFKFPESPDYRCLDLVPPLIISRSYKLLFVKAAGVVGFASMFFFILLASIRRSFCKLRCSFKRRED